MHGLLWYSHTRISIWTYQELKDNRNNALLSSLMIIQLIQHQNDCNQHANTPSSNSVCMTMQVECIINNPVKLATLNHVNLYTHNWFIYIHRLNCTSSSLAIWIEIHVWLYHTTLLWQSKNALFKWFFQQSLFQCCNVRTRMLLP